MNIQLKRFNHIVLDAINCDKTEAIIVNYKQKQMESHQQFRKQFNNGEYSDFTFMKPGKRNIVGHTNRKYVVTNPVKRENVE